jgi:hypothetical protein
MDIPDARCHVGDVFGIETELVVPCFAQPTEHVPTPDPSYRFDRDTTLAILAGFAHNRRVLIQGFHGTGKTSHIEQVAARLNWPCLRINLDSQVSRVDLVGKDAVVLRDGKQVTEFRPGILTWALQHPTALVFDEYDAGRHERRRLLIVLSDGSPHDESTLRNNPPDLLERHLRTVIQWIEQHPRIELLAIGMGHDVSRFYRRATAIASADGLGETLITCLRELFDP